MGAVVAHRPVAAVGACLARRRRGRRRRAKPGTGGPSRRRCGASARTGARIAAPRCTRRGRAAEGADRLTGARPRRHAGPGSCSLKRFRALCCCWCVFSEEIRGVYFREHVFSEVELARPTHRTAGGGRWDVTHCCFCRLKAEAAEPRTAITRTPAGSEHRQLRTRLPTDTKAPRPPDRKAAFPLTRRWRSTTGCRTTVERHWPSGGADNLVEIDGGERRRRDRLHEESELEPRADEDRGRAVERTLLGPLGLGRSQFYGAQ